MCYNVNVFQKGGIPLQRTTGAETYSQEVDIKNTHKLRELSSKLPRFCRQYFRGIAENTSTRTRVAYAHDLMVFFEFLHANNRCAPKWRFRISRSLFWIS